jgi:formyltetrahydrofolate-dependent phosphoribosylglycinamide formyltransferase
MTATLAVLISGNGSNLQAIIDAVAGGRLDAQIAVVISNRKDAFGLTRAQRAGIPTRYHPLKPYRDRGEDRRAYDADLAALLAEFAPDWIVLAGWMHIFSNAFLDHFSGRVVNLHPALPGQFPGAHAIEDALAAFHRGEINETGIMVHLVPDERVDEGPVLATRTISIYADDTLESLATRIHAAEHALLVKTLQSLIRNSRRLSRW